jgi:hypothetical protein
VAGGRRTHRPEVGLHRQLIARQPVTGPRAGGAMDADVGHRAAPQPDLGVELVECRHPILQRQAGDKGIKEALRDIVDGALDLALGLRPGRPIRISFLEGDFEKAVPCGGLKTRRQFDCA